MYNICKERNEPLDVDGLIDDEDEITIKPCPCTQEGKTLEVHVPYASVEFHWKHKQIEYWGDYGGLIKMNYCPFCGRKL